MCIRDRVEESTLKELTGLWLANGECVPSLKELLETAKRKTSLKLVLELKAHSKPEREIKAVEEIVSMIKKMGLEPRMIYITFSSHALKELIRQAPTSTPVYYLKGDLSPQQLKELGSAGPDYHFSEFYRYTDCIIRKSKFPQNPKRSVRFSGKRTKRSVQKRKARNTQKAETKVL